MSTTLSAKPVAGGRLRWLAPAGVAILMLCYLALVLSYAVNVPWMDDIDAFINFILAYLDAPTAGEKLNWLLRPNNEHRIFLAKLITVVMYTLTGEVNFRWLIFVAYLFQLGIFGLFYRVFQSTKLPLIAFLPIALIYWQPQYHLTSIWALTGLQHEVVICLTLVALYLLSSEERSRFAMAVSIQVVASLSMSNGLFGWVAGAVVLFLQRQWLRLGIWLAVGVAAIVFYFHDFQSPQGNESSFSFFLSYPYLVVAGFFTFTGALFDFLPVHSNILWRSILPTLAGLILIPTALWLVWRMNWPLWGQSTEDKSRRKRRYFFTGCYAFLFVNAAVVAFLRPRFGYSVMLVGNYMIYPAILTLLIYLNGVSEFKSVTLATRWLRTGLVVGGLVWGISYGLHWPEVAYRKQRLLTYAFNQQYNDAGLGPTWGTSFADMVREVMHKSVQRGIYRYPSGYFTPYEADLHRAATTPVDPALDLRISGGDYSYLAELLSSSLNHPISQAAVVVQSAQRTYLFPSELPFTTSAFYLNRPVQAVKAEILPQVLAPDTYRIGVLVPPGDGRPVRISRQQLQIP